MLTFHKHSPTSQSYDPYREAITAVPTFRLKTELEDDVICPGSHSRWQREGLKPGWSDCSTCTHCWTVSLWSEQHATQAIRETDCGATRAGKGVRESQQSSEAGARQRRGKQRVGSKPLPTPTPLWKEVTAGKRRTLVKRAQFPGCLAEHILFRGAAAAYPLTPGKSFWIWEAYLTSAEVTCISESWGVGSAWKGLLGRRQLFESPRCPS